MTSLVLMLGFRLALASPFDAVPLDQLNIHSFEHPHPPGSQEFWTKLVISVILVLAGGVFAGYALFLPDDHT